MFYVFGGVYKESGNMLDGPHYFMQYDVIIVVPNYRLGPLGMHFESTFNYQIYFDFFFQKIFVSRF